MLQNIIHLGIFRCVIMARVLFYSVCWTSFYKVSFCRMLPSRMIKLAKHYSTKYYSSWYIHLCYLGESVILLIVADHHSERCHSAECHLVEWSIQLSIILPGVILQSIINPDIFLCVIQVKMSFNSVWWASFYKVSFGRMLLGRMIKLANHYYTGHYSTEHHSSQYILVSNSGESVILLGVVERHSTKCHSTECRGAILSSTKCLIEGFESNWVCDALKKNFSVDVTNKVEIRGPYWQQFTLF